MKKLSPLSYVVKLLLLALPVSFFVPCPGAVQAQDDTDGGWQAAYWDNLTFAGQPRMTRLEPTIDHNWGEGSPAPGVIAPERFSARWTRSLTLAPGRYRFEAIVDDGVRLWVNDQLVIDQWRVQSRQVYQVNVTVDGGTTPLRLDYFENTGQAEVRLTWQSLDAATATPNQETPARAAPTGGTSMAVGAPVNVWHGEYFDNSLLTDPPSLVRNESQLNFDWGDGSPALGVIAPERFSVRWTRTLSLTPGRYEFTAAVDDGIRLWVDGRLVLSDWTVHSLRALRATVDVVGGATPVRVEYFENSGRAAVQLTWRQVLPSGLPPAADPVPQPPPEAAPVATATVVQARYVNLRSGPGPGFAVVGVLANGEVVQLLGRNMRVTWLVVRLADGRVGWVNSYYLGSATRFWQLPLAS